MVLERLDLPAERRRREVQLGGGALEAQRARGAARRRAATAVGGRSRGIAHRGAGRAARYAATIGASSSGVAPCRITPSAPSSNWRADLRDALRGAAGRRRREPLGGNQRRDPLELLGRRLGVDRAAEARDQRVGAEARERRGIPAVRLHQQIAVRLQVRRQPPDGLLEAQRLGEVIADGREARPDAHARGIAARRFRRRASPSRTQRAVVSSVKKVCSTTASKSRPPSSSEFGRTP